MIRTVVAREMGGVGGRVLVLNFEVPEEAFDLFGAVREACSEYCETPEGQRIFQGNCDYFNWEDFSTNVPEEICRRHGFSFMRSVLPDVCVDLAEQLVEDFDD